MRTLEQYLRSRYRPGTVDRYLRAIDLFTKSLGSDGAKLAKYRHVLDYLQSLREQKLGIDHINTELYGIKQYYKYLVKTGQRIDDPTRNLYMKDNKNRDIQFQDLFSPEELELLLERPDRYRLLAWRNKLVVSLYIYQALTTGEQSRLRVSDLDMDKGSVFIRASAKASSRVLPLKANQVMFIERYLTFDRPYLVKEDTDALIISKLGNAENGEGIHYLIESMRMLFPDKKLNPITIRQSVIVNMFRQGKDIREVQLFAGHRYASTTERYMPSDLSELKGALERFHPLG